MSNKETAPMDTGDTGLDGLFRRTDIVLRDVVRPVISQDAGVLAAHRERVEALLAGPVVVTGADLLHLTEIAKYAVGVSRTQERGWEDYREWSDTATKAQLLKMARENKQACLERLVDAVREANETLNRREMK